MKKVKEGWRPPAVNPLSLFFIRTNCGIIQMFDFYKLGVEKAVWWDIRGEVSA